MVVTGLTVDFSAGLAAATTAAGGVEAGSAFDGPSSNVWNSKTLIFCGLPSSVMVKSEGFKPSTGLPSLPLIRTSSTTNCVVVEITRSFLASLAAGAGGCWAETVNNPHNRRAIADRGMD